MPLVTVMSVTLPDPERDLDALLATVDRLDELADAAELMDDEDGAARLRMLAARRRLEVMARFDG